LTVHEAIAKTKNSTAKTKRLHTK